MKRIILGVLVVLILSVSLVGCETSQVSNIPETTPTPEKTPTPAPTPEPLTPIEELCEYIFENGDKSTDTGSETYFIVDNWADGFSVSIIADKNKNSQEVGFVYIMNILDVEHKFIITIPQNESEYVFAFQQNGNLNISYAGILNPETYEIKLNICNNTKEETANSLALSNIKALANRIPILLQSSGLVLKFDDFGFSQDIYTMEIEYPNVEPAPISIKINKIKSNSAGTPEAYIQFTNTGDKTIEVFDFYVKCYNAYGEVVKGYERYDYYSGVYDDKKLAPGKTTPSNWRWDMFGFDLTKTIEVAVCKYKLEGEEAVEIRDLVWVKMD